MVNFLFFITILVASASLSKCKTLHVGILHYNDLEGQLFPFKKDTFPPETCNDDEDSSNCLGGFMQIGGHIKNETFKMMGQLFDSHFTIATGNLVSGKDGWLSFLNQPYSWKTHGLLIQNHPYFPNYFSPNFTSLGPREFDGGMTTINSYVNAYQYLKIKVRPLISNVNCENQKLSGEKEFCSYVDSFDTLDIKGYKVGLIGFVNPSVVHLSNPGKLVFLDPISALQEIVDEYLQHVDTVIAFGSGSLALAKSIADKIQKVKVVIYGAEEKDHPHQNEYPLRYNNKFIATAGMYGSSIGKLIFQLETNTGDISVMEDSKLIVVDNSVEPDKELRDEFDTFKRADRDNNKNLATAKITIDGEKAHCWRNECSLGNVVADAMVHCAFNDKSLTLPADLIAVWHAGGLANTWMKAGSSIKVRDPYNWLPFSNNVTLVTINGAILKKLFEISAKALNEVPVPDWGQLLQISNGLEVNYVIENGIATVRTLRAVRLSEDGRLRFANVEDHFIYNIVIPSDLYYGHNAFWELPGSFISAAGHSDHTFIGPDYTCLKNYVENMGVVSISTRRRITIYLNESNNSKMNETNTMRL